MVQSGSKFFSWRRVLLCQYCSLLNQKHILSQLFIAVSQRLLVTQRDSIIGWLLFKLPITSNTSLFNITIDSLTYANIITFLQLVSSLHSVVYYNTGPLVDLNFYILYRCYRPVWHVNSRPTLPSKDEIASHSLKLFGSWVVRRK